MMPPAVAVITWNVVGGSLGSFGSASSSATPSRVRAKALAHGGQLGLQRLDVGLHIGRNQAEIRSFKIHVA